MKTFDEWFSSKQGEAYDSMYCFARDAWKAAQEVEREACAKVCDARSGIWTDAAFDATDVVAEGLYLAATIRARGNN